MEFYQICNHCVMDSSDPEIRFDAEGVCNHCHNYRQTEKEWDLEGHIKSHSFQKMIEEIRLQGQGQDWDCIMGLSGGVDSSYVAHLAKQNGLRPLCVHLDNGWNSELAVANIHNIVKKCEFELYTHVIDWEEFKDLQRSFFKAHVIDIELLSDHAIFGVILQLARRHNIKFILSGANIATEAIMPARWVHRKQDLANIEAIQKKFGTRPLRTFPKVSTLEHVFYMYLRGYKVLKPLNLIKYNKSQAKEILKHEFSWRDYGGKHYESIFTKFYQAHILPVKFGVDKRRAHLSTLINSGQMSREEALSELKKPLYNEAELAADKEYVCKKLGFSLQEMDEYLRTPPRSHYDFATDQWLFDKMKLVSRWLKVSRV